ncbi:(Fe-S)-binding protein [Candidatus Woesearchaeota archaeon]|nr:(Fe-S)-binding protein [Candidatus Woesearchaeota archaeon]
MVFDKISNALGFGNIAYFPGCLTKHVLPKIEQNYKKILDKMGIDYITIDLSCCGSPCQNAGYETDFQLLLNKNLADFKKYGVKKIITNCPACYKVLKEQYKLNVEHISTVIWKNIKNFEPNKFDEQISYHDPCHLGRHSGIYEEPRNILKHLGFKIVEMRGNREKALCCGGGAGMKSNFPNESNKIAKLRLEQVKTHKLVTFCPLCYSHLKENAEDTQVIEFSEVML